MRREQRVSRPGVLRAARASDTMDIVLRVVRVVIVYDELHVFHICTRECAVLPKW